jgi:hypothetical protein
MFGRLKRLWELSGTLSDLEDERLAEEIKQQGHFYRKSKSQERARKGQRMATILAETDPFEGIPGDDIEDNENTTDKQPSDS